MSNLPLQFETYLKENLNVSGKTLRNYRADLGYFSRWAETHLAEQGIEASGLETLLPHFSGFLVVAYREHHIANSVPQSTTNRRLSTLRNFGKFLAHVGLTSHNPAQLVTNLKQEQSHAEKLQALMQEFAKHLEAEGASKVTAKNYLSDVRHFTAWLVKQEDWIKEPASTAKRGEQEIQLH